MHKIDFDILTTLFEMTTQALNSTVSIDIDVADPTKNYLKLSKFVWGIWQVMFSNSDQKL